MEYERVESIATLLPPPPPPPLEPSNPVSPVGMVSTFAEAKGITSEIAYFNEAEFKDIINRLLVGTLPRYPPLCVYV